MTVSGSISRTGQIEGLAAYFALFDYSLPHGPVLSFTLNKINAEPDPEGGSYWHEYISERQDNEVSLLVDRVPNDQLSPAEERFLDDIGRLP